MPRIDPAHLEMLRSKADRAARECEQAMGEQRAANEKYRAAYDAAEKARGEMFAYIDEFIKIEDLRGRW